MARTVRDAKLDSRAARLRLRMRREPYWRSISEGMAVGYRRGVKGGTWIGKHYEAANGRRYKALGTADDIADADGVNVLSFAQAQELARNWFAELAQIEPDGHRREPYSVRQCISDYLSWLEVHRKPGSSIRSRAEVMILSKLGETLCADLTTRQLQGWLRDLAASPARLRTKKGAKQRYREAENADPEAVRQRRASANRVLTILKAALNRAWREGKIASDSAWRRVQPFREVDAPRVRYLTVEQAQRLINASVPEFRRLVQAALCTGARYGELGSLQASDFNPDSETLHIRTSKSGKGRHIVLNREGSAFFRALAAGKPDNAPLLTKADGSLWRDANQARPMRAACKSARIKPAVSFHILRHTWASLAVMSGAPLMVIARNLGHADTRMVERHYGHLAPSFIADAIRAAAPKFGIKPERNVHSLRASR